MNVTKNFQYEINLHNSIVADSFKEALEIAKSILADLEKLAKLEKEGKIKGECGCDSPSLQSITIIDKSIEPELQKISLVSCFEYESEDARERSIGKDVSYEFNGGE